MSFSGDAKRSGHWPTYPAIKTLSSRRSPERLLPIIFEDVVAVDPDMRTRAGPNHAAEKEDVLTAAMRLPLRCVGHDRHGVRMAVEAYPLSNREVPGRAVIGQIVSVRRGLGGRAGNSHLRRQLTGLGQDVHDCLSIVVGWAARNHRQIPIVQFGMNRKSAIIISQIVLAIGSIAGLADLHHSRRAEPPDEHEDAAADQHIDGPPARAREVRTAIEQWHADARLADHLSDPRHRPFDEPGRPRGLLPVRFQGHERRPQQFELLPRLRDDRADTLRPGGVRRARAR